MREEGSRTMARSKLTIAPKFFLVLAVVGPLMLALAFVGLHGLNGMRAESDAIFQDNVRTTEKTLALARHVLEARGLALELIAVTSPARRRTVSEELDQRVIPAVEADLAALHLLHAGDPVAERRTVAQLPAAWRRFLALRHSHLLELQAVRSKTAARDRLADEVDTALAPVAKLTNQFARLENVEAAGAHESSQRTYRTSRDLIIGIALSALALGVGSVLVLIRNVVPRVREYSGFAGRVASGDLSGRLDPKGADELATLGHALNSMVERRAAEEAQLDKQSEFVSALQATEGEEEAHTLLKRHVERTIRGSEVVVLNRNNSADRLEPTTELPESSELPEALAHAKPRTCLAVRFGHTHCQGVVSEPLVDCAICGKAPGAATCEPLLVGGEVIGSVLTMHPEPLPGQQTQAIRDSVAQAAPVLANLRNLAIAEVRAATDALTGLPNNRAARDTIKRLVAHASRTVSPLAAMLLDLDHFKQINDTLGHGKGDDVLAAVGATLRTTLRESDFVARYGGEEFVVLLPATGREDAQLVGEKIREAIAQIRVAGVERAITISVGIASLPDDAGDAATLLRVADRALYSAKANGRNRVEVAASAEALAEPV
jgi:diguanylate cyclase (GGDEF)-like protein